MRLRRPDPQHRPGDRLVGPEEPAEHYWEQLERRRADDGPARARLRPRQGSAGRAPLARRPRSPSRSGAPAPGSSRPARTRCSATSLRVPVALEVRPSVGKSPSARSRAGRRERGRTPSRRAVVEHGLGRGQPALRELVAAEGVGDPADLNAADHAPTSAWIAPGPSAVLPSPSSLGADEDRDLAQVLVVPHQLMRLGDAVEADRPPQHRPDLRRLDQLVGLGCTPRRWRSASR